MLHDSGKSIAVSFGFVPEKLPIGKNSALEKLDLLFSFIFLMKLVICVCVVCVVYWCELGLGLGAEWWNFVSQLPGDMANLRTVCAHFPTRISHKIFPQEIPTRFSHKIFPSWILIGWLPITLFQMLNFHQLLLC